MKYLLILLIFTLSASARVGETKAQCDKRYGKPINEPRKATENHPPVYAYKTKDWKIYIAFEKGKAIMLTYYKADGKKNITKAIGETIAKINLPNVKWGRGIFGKTISVDKRYFKTIESDAISITDWNGVATYRKRVSSNYTKGL